MNVVRWARHVLGTVRTYRNPLLRASDHYGFMRTDRRHLVHLRNGLKFRVRGGTSDFGVLDDVYLRGVYNRALEHIGAGDIVVDIGAQCGAFAVAAASLGARVLCYEPLGENVALLRENADLNNCTERITIEEAAVTGEAGIKTLHVARGDTGGATFFPEIHPLWSTTPGVTQRRVQSITLDDIFVRAHLDTCECLKMDCEGAEYGIIGASDGRCLEKIRMIILEYHPNGDIRALGQRLRQGGFIVEIRAAPCVLLAQRSA